MQSLEYSELFSILRESSQGLNDHMALLRSIIARKDFTFKANVEEVMKESIRLFCLKLYQKWCKSARNYKNFMQINATWLKSKFFILQEALEIRYVNCDEPSTSDAKNLKPFSQLGYRQKKQTYRNITKKQYSRGVSVCDEIDCNLQVTKI